MDKWQMDGTYIAFSWSNRPLVVLYTTCHSPIHTNTLIHTFTLMLQPPGPFWVQHLAKDHFDIQSGGGKDRTTGLLFKGWPNLTQHLHPSWMFPWLTLIPFLQCFAWSGHEMLVFIKCFFPLSPEVDSTCLKLNCTKANHDKPFQIALGLVQLPLLSPVEKRIWRHLQLFCFPALIDTFNFRGAVTKAYWLWLCNQEVDSRRLSNERVH